MGRAPRPRPSRLAEKLLQIRRALGLTQEQMFELLNYQDSPLYATHISEFEIGKREPPILLLLQYARVAGVALEIIVDDKLDLPERLPDRIKTVGSREPYQRSRRGIDTQLPVSNKNVSCTHCGSSNRQIKAGRNRAGSQRYQCFECGRHYTPDPSLLGYPEEVRRKAVLLYENGLKNFRLIGYILNVNHQSTANWIKAYLDSLSSAGDSLN